MTTNQGDGAGAASTKRGNNKNNNNDKNVVLYWFRLGDLRLHDNPAFCRAVSMCANYADDNATGSSAANALLVPIFCFDPAVFGDGARASPSPSTSTTTTDFLKCGPRRARFVLEGVADLRRSLENKGSGLFVAPAGTKPEDFADRVVRELLSGGGAKKKTTATLVYQDEPCSEERFAANKVQAKVGKSEAVWGSTLYELTELPYYDAEEDKKKGRSVQLLQGMPDTFTPFRNKVEKSCTIPKPIPTPNKLPSLPESSSSEFLRRQSSYLPTLSELGYTEEQIEREVGGVADPRGVMEFRGGETTALQRVKEYIWDKDLLRTYFDTRNGMIGADYSSKFAPWLAHGNLSPRYVAQQCHRYEQERVANKSTYWLVFELLWRDYCKFFALKYGTSIFMPGGTIDSQKEWKYWDKTFAAWKDGMTGFPLVDANMRELAATGFMSNRGRQNVCSFLAHELGQDWRYGGAYFESVLIDYDVHSNWVNWLFGAGMAGGRLNRFNIVKQSKDYDQHGEYVRRWLPELKDVPTQFVHEPWKMTQFQQLEYGCKLGVDYPHPVVKPFYPPNKKDDKSGGGRGGGGGGGDNRRKGKNRNRGGGGGAGPTTSTGRGQRQEMKSVPTGAYRFQD